MIDTTYIRYYVNLTIFVRHDDICASSCFLRFARVKRSDADLAPIWVAKSEPVLVCVYGLTHRLSSVMAPMLGEALWELERPSAVEFVVDGNGIEVMRGLATMVGTLRTLAQVFSLESYEGHPDIWEGFHGNLEAVLTNAGIHEYREY